MLLYFLLCNSLLMSAISCTDSISIVSKSNTGTTLPPGSKDKLAGASSTMKVALLSEGGGSILSNALGLTLPERNNTIPVNDVVKNKIVARKGADYTEGSEISQENHLSIPSIENTTNKLSTSGEKPHTYKKQENITNELSVLKGNSVVKNINNTNEIKILKTPKKPLTLVADNLENMVAKSPGVVINNLVSTQPSPKTPYITRPSGPGMVMPIVITILLVPMFAVLGYMALRRGQEAWKNRHYKRMDFLLDGMYND